jgi:carboxyl-terminal processing protease
LGRNIQKPYTQGYEKYEEEITGRFHSGEVLKGDTTKKSGPAFRTPKGRIVYGGGGITPDIYVSFDTASMGREALKLYMKGTLSNFIYSYFMQHKQQFSEYKKTADFAAFKAGENEWNALKKFAARDSVDLDKIGVKDKSAIIKRIPAMLARQLWRYEGYYEVMNQSDDFVQKALQVLKEKSIQR